MREFHVLNLGAGVQSTCLFLLAREPDATLRFDVAIFADTGEEPAAVYKHLDYLQSLGQPTIWVRSAGKLGDYLIHGVNSTGQRFASVPPSRRRIISFAPAPNPSNPLVIDCDTAHKLLLAQGW